MLGPQFLLAAAGAITAYKAVDALTGGRLSDSITGALEKGLASAFEGPSGLAAIDSLEPSQPKPARVVVNTGPGSQTTVNVPGGR